MKKRALFYLTRRTSFLWKSAGVLAAVLFTLGTAISFLNSNRMDAYQKIIATPQFVNEYTAEFDELHAVTPPDQLLISAAITEMLQDDSPFPERLMKVANLLYFISPNETILIPTIANLSTNQQMIARALASACSNPEDESSIRPLEELSRGTAVVPDANYALALAFDARKDNDASILALTREIELHNSGHARERLIGLYVGLKNFAALETLSEDPQYKPFITPYVQLDLALNRMDWPRILKTHFKASYAKTNPAMVILAILSGLIWAILLTRFNGSLSTLKFTLPAVVLGALSTHATLLFIYWQEYQLGVSMGNDTIGQLIYCVLGIGFREELLKLLLFVPLIPFLLKRTDLEILTVAGLVGLGFALEENINYFEASAGLSAIGRFATANFLHIALTAMCGLTLTRAIVHRGEDIQHATVTFILAVAIHGLYDAFIMVPAFMDYSWLTYTVFILMGYQYFGWLRHLRDEWNDPISITSTFTYGILLVTGFSFALYAWNSGPMAAFQAVANEAIAVAIILILFYREIPETLEG